MRYLLAILCIVAVSTPLFGAEKDVGDQVNLVIDKVANHMDAFTQKTGLAINQLRPAFDEVLYEYRLRGIIYCSLGVILVLICLPLFLRFAKRLSTAANNSPEQTMGIVGAIICAILGIVGFALAVTWLQDATSPAVIMMEHVLRHM